MKHKGLEEAVFFGKIELCSAARSHKFDKYTPLPPTSTYSLCTAPSALFSGLGQEALSQSPTWTLLLTSLQSHLSILNTFALTIPALLPSALTMFSALTPP